MKPGALLVVKSYFTHRKSAAAWPDQGRPKSPTAELLKTIKQSKDVSNFEQSQDGGETSVQERLTGAPGKGGQPYWDRNGFASIRGGGATSRLPKFSRTLVSRRTRAAHLPHLGAVAEQTTRVVSGRDDQPAAGGEQISAAEQEDHPFGSGIRRVDR